MIIYELTRFKEIGAGLKNQITIILLRYDPLIVFRWQNRITFIFIKTMSHDLLVQMAYYITLHLVLFTQIVL